MLNPEHESSYHHLVQMIQQFQMFLQNQFLQPIQMILQFQQIQKNPKFQKFLQNQMILL
jgi:hypothetical protein